MAQVAGNLFKGVQDALAANDGKVGVLIIDQPEPSAAVEDDAVSAVTRHQQYLIKFASSVGCLFWRIEAAPPGVARDFPTLVRLRGLIPPSSPVIKKAKFNAFDSTSLETDLNTAGVKYLVLLGHAANHCVKQTAVGGSFYPNGPVVPGATGRNFIVLTTSSVLSTNNGEATWKDADGVRFYATLI